MNSKLIIQLSNCVRELERLRYIHLPLYEGKVGEPDIVVINEAKKLVEELQRDL